MSHPRVRTNPALPEAEALVSEALFRGAFIIVVTDCQIDYRGRSSSKMGWGERVVMLKPDNSVLIHRKTGFDAVNWQPPGCHITLSIQGGELTIRADRRRPRETLSINCRKVSLVSAFSLTDEASFDMLLSEQDLYRVFRSTPDLVEKGFRISSEQKGLGGGKADLTGYDRAGRYTVVEVKRVAADTDAVKQLYRYVSEMRETSPDVRGILLAPSIRSTAKRLARSLSVEFHPIDLRKCAAKLSDDASSGSERLDRHLT